MGREFGVDVHKSEECVINVWTDLGGTIRGWDPGRRRDTICYDSAEDFRCRGCVRRKETGIDLIQG